MVVSMIMITVIMMMMMKKLTLFAGKIVREVFAGGEPSAEKIHVLRNLPRRKELSANLRRENAGVNALRGATDTLQKHERPRIKKIS